MGHNIIGLALIQDNLTFTEHSVKPGIDSFMALVNEYSWAFI